MKFSMQPLVNERIWKMLNFLFFIYVIIHDVTYLMNLGNEYKITSCIIFRKVMFIKYFDALSVNLTSNEGNVSFE